MKLSRLALVCMAAVGTVILGASAVSGRDAIQADRSTRAEIIQAAAESPARNVIFLVGDGMGIQEITAARYYQGVQNAWNLDRLPYTGLSTTWSVKKGPGPTYLPDYAPDSASTATMFATGRKTLDERLSQSPTTSTRVPGKAWPTVLEAAQARGLRVGSVTTAELTDATPAAMAAHISKRVCRGPANMADCPTETKAAGGLGSIAEQTVDHEVGVLLGGGRSRFEQPVTAGPDAGRTVLEAAKVKGYKVTTDRAGLQALTPSGQPVLGLFSGGTLPSAWSGPAATTGKGTAATACTEGQLASRYPTLAQMTSKALELLESPEGFFLQVEGASIDKNAHRANACGQIGETVAFDKAVGVAVDYQQRHPETLVVVTADHSQATQIVADDWSGTALPTGYSVTLRTKDGSPLTLHYGTSGYGGEGKPAPASAPDQQHTGAMVPVWAIGPGAAAVLGTNDHTELFGLLGG